MWWGEGEKKKGVGEERGSKDSYQEKDSQDLWIQQCLIGPSSPWASCWWGSWSHSTIFGSYVFKQTKELMLTGYTVLLLY